VAVVDVASKRNGANIIVAWPYQVMRKFRVWGGEGQEDMHIIAGFILSHKD